MNKDFSHVQYTQKPWNYHNDKPVLYDLCSVLSICTAVILNSPRQSHPVHSHQSRWQLLNRAIPGAAFRDWRGDVGALFKCDANNRVVRENGDKTWASRESAWEEKKIAKRIWQAIKTFSWEARETPYGISVQTNGECSRVEAKPALFMCSLFLF